MPNTLIESIFHTEKHKPKTKQQIKNTKSILPPNLQAFKEKILSGNGFISLK